MFIKHKLKKGEDFKSVMRKYKLTDWSAVWNLKGNSALRKKRKYADKVEPGDVLVLWDGKVNYYPVVVGGKKYLIPEKEWGTAKTKIIGEMNKKFLGPLGKIKQRYDDDFAYLQDIANNDAIAGVFAAMMENLSGAKLPTKEMANASTAVRDLQKKILAGKFADVGRAALKAEIALKLYAQASEKYRRKMTNASDTGVKVVKFVDDHALDLAGAIATAQLTRMSGGRCSPAEIGAAVGALKGLIKGSANELGRSIAGEDRSAEEIGANIFVQAAVGAATGAVLGGVMGSAQGKAFFDAIGKAVSKALPNTVATLIRVEGQSLLGSPSLLKGLGPDVAAAKVAAMMARMSAAKQMAYIKKYCGKHKSEMMSAITSVMKKLKGTESEKDFGEKIAAQAAKSGMIDGIIREMIIGQRKPIVTQLEKIEVTAE